MRGSKFFRIEAVVAVCILTSLLTGEPEFAAWAKGKPLGTEIYYGYAQLADEDSYVIQSDDGQYIDQRIEGGEDRVEIELEVGTQEVRRSSTTLGMVKYKRKRLQYMSSRRVRFLFDVDGDAIGTPPGAGMAVYDILSDYIPGYVHFTVMYWASETVFDYAAFIIDGVTQDALDESYPNEPVEKYRTTDDGHIIYYLGYWDYPDLNPDSLIPIGEPPTWEIEPLPGVVTLYVIVVKGKFYGPIDHVELATYEALPFKLTISLDPPESASQAPSRYNTLSSTWGEMKR